jgi:aspartate/tyrosine/aromatic aminotransferase
MPNFYVYCGNLKRNLKTNDLVSDYETMQKNNIIILQSVGGNYLFSFCQSRG